MNADVKDEMLDRELAELDDMRWRCRDGRVMRVSEMETRHIMNCIWMIKRSRKPNGSLWRERYLKRLEQEVMMRTMRDALRKGLGLTRGSKAWG